MKRILSTFLILFLFSGCEKARELRVDDLAFGNKRTGTRTESPTFKPGEQVHFSYKIRGFYPDERSMAKLSYTVSITGRDEALVEVKNEVFKVNSELTSYGPRKPQELNVPDKNIEKGLLTFVVTDEVKGTTITREYPFSVAK